MSMTSIKQGQTLSGLVHQYNKQHGSKFTVADIAKANGIKDPNRIQAGTKLIFPDKFEANAKQQVIRNADGQKMVRNGVKESVTVTMPKDEPLVTTEPTPLSTTIQTRPTLPLMSAESLRRTRILQ
jgi:LysM repeat protein